MKKKKTNANHPASPCLVEIRENYNEQFHGLTKREYFAAVALQGMLAVENSYRSVGVYKRLPQDAIEMADVLIEELNK